MSYLLPQRNLLPFTVYDCVEQPPASCILYSSLYVVDDIFRYLIQEMVVIVSIGLFALVVGYPIAAIFIKLGLHI